eukprot:11855505-Alexandrium_andersonii.AAC.1
MRYAVDLTCRLRNCAQANSQQWCSVAGTLKPPPALPGSADRRAPSTTRGSAHAPLEGSAGSASD